MTSRSQMTPVRTPSMTFVRSVTVKTTRCGRRPSPRFARPTKTNCLPGTSGSQALSTRVGCVKRRRSKSRAVACSGPAAPAASGSGTGAGPGSAPQAPTAIGTPMHIDAAASPMRRPRARVRLAKLLDGMLSPPAPQAGCATTTDTSCHARRACARPRSDKSTAEVGRGLHLTPVWTLPQRPERLTFS